MFAEKLGLFFFKRVGLVIFLSLLALGPICVGLYLYNEKQTIDLLWEQFYASSRKAKTAIAKKERKEKFVVRHSHSDPYFVNKEIESLVFLADEQALLKKWMNHPSIAHKQPLKQRLHFLESGENVFRFKEEEVQFSKLYKETVEKQRDPVEMNNDDLKKILSLIEESSTQDASQQTNRPQLIVSEFYLQKKENPLRKEVLEVKFDLFKREFLSP